MASETSRIASTPLLGLVPLGGAGDRAYGRLVGALAARFPDHRYAAILAEPEPFEDGSAVNWHVPGYVKAVPLAELPEERARVVHNTLLEISGNIRAYADELDKAKGSPTDRSLADGLRNAMCVPGPEYIYAVGNQPVLVAWAYSRDAHPPLEIGIVRQIPDTGVARPEPRPVASPPAPAPTLAPLLASAPAIAIHRPFPWHWLLWLLFALVVGTILWLLLTACALNVGNSWYPGLRWCGSSPTIVNDDANRIAELQGLIDNLEGQTPPPPRVCVAPVEARREPVRPPQDDVTARDIEKRREEANARSGDLQISLGWNGTADLDLHVICPGGEKISYDHKSACGGVLQIDMNAGGNRSETPIEDVIFPSIASIPPGTLQIGVAWYGDNNETRTSIPVTIVIKRGGAPQEIHVDVPRPNARPGSPVIYHRITVP